MKPKVYIFDIDDTVIIHTRNKYNIYNMNSDTELKKLINTSDQIETYIYTNGTYGHAYGVLDNLDMNPITNDIFARDNIPYMKPLDKSFDHVNKIVTNYGKRELDIYFFDDMIENLLTANKFGWKTIWISFDFLKKPSFIDYAFPNIYDALIYFKSIEGQ
tara:strand:- start:287 stop:766 length:480 start_codon:yes stop_codon:yes gene_type:complete